MAENSGRKPPVKIYGNDALSTRIAAFQKKAEEHREKQMINPFSSWEGASHRQKLDKTDPRYGRPVEGSKTDKRGKQAGVLVNNEIRVLCDMIYDYGDQHPDGTAAICFGELFEIYTRISNKLVGMLMRGRKHGLLHFEGEMLFQRRDDHVVIHLLKPISEVRGLCGDTSYYEYEKKKRAEQEENGNDDA